MHYKELYREANEQAAERFSLVAERVAGIAKEAETIEPFAS